MITSPSGRVLTVCMRLVPVLTTSKRPAGNRRTSSGAPFNPDEAITAEQALRAWTWGSAYASRQEHVKGSVAPGMLADLVVLSEDPTAVRPERIAGLEVLATIVGGEIRYGTLS